MRISARGLQPRFVSTRVPFASSDRVTPRKLMEDYLERLFGETSQIIRLNDHSGRILREITSDIVVAVFQHVVVGKMGGKREEEKSVNIK